MSGASASASSLCLTGSTITIFMTGGGSVFVTRAVTSRCFRLYCSEYFRSSNTGGRGPRRRPRDFDDLLKRHFLVVPVACRPSRLPRLNGRLVGRVLDLLEVIGAKISLGSF